MDRTAEIRMINTADAAGMLGVSTHTLRGWRNADAGPPWYKIEGSIRYNLADLLEWIEQQAVDGARDSASNSAGQQSRGATRHGRMDEA